MKREFEKTKSNRVPGESETARQLYVHRNTLVYRLERLEKLLGLDIRKFEDAMTFKIALMVMSHMESQKNEI